MRWSKAVLLVAATILFSVSYRGLNLYDEGIILAGSLRVMNGEVPYRDFWAMYPPGNFYINAWLFSLFGEQAYWNRLFDALTKMAIVLVSYAIIRTWLSRGRSLFFATCVLLFLLAIGTPGFPVFQATLLALVMLLTLMRADQVGPDGGAPRTFFVLIFLAGTLNGLMVWFRHDLAAYALLSVIIWFGASIIIPSGARPGSAGVPPAGGPEACAPRKLAGVRIKAWFGYLLFRSCGRSGQVGCLVKEVGVFALGVALTFVPLAVYLLASAGYADLYFSLIESPATIYPDYRALPFPELTLSRLFAPSGESLVYFPFTILVLSVMVFGVSAWRAGTRHRAAVALEPGLHDARLGLLLFSLVALLSVKGLIRPNILHFAPAILFGLILAAYLSRRQSWKGFAPLAVLLLAFFAHTALTAVKKSVRNLPQFIAACQQPANPRLVCVNADRDTLDAARFIATEFPAVRELFVGTGAHDRIHVGNVAAYFLVPKQPATKWHESHPGIQTRADIQREIITELRGSESLVVLVDRRWDNEREPNRSAESSGNTDLDRFLADSFRLVKEFGPIAIYTRKQTE